MYFAPIITQYCRLTFVPTDMPLTSPFDIPNMRLFIRNRLGLVALPFRVTGLARVGTNMGHVAAEVTRLLVEQMNRTETVRMYGECILTDRSGTPVTNPKKEVEANLIRSLPSRTGINYRTDRVGSQRVSSNYMLLAISNGAQFRNWTSEAEYLSRNSEEERASRAATGQTELHGACTIFGKPSYCSLTHDFFDLRRFTPEIWAEHVTTRVFEVFPFMKDATLFTDLQFIPTM
jgi:hypothetical protein